jgi:hypothetical protein
LLIAGKKPLTFGKAKRENIKHQRFPIDRYVKYVLLLLSINKFWLLEQQQKKHYSSRFGGGSGKSLTLDQVYNILMTLKHTGSWVEAFKYIP